MLIVSIIILSALFILNILVGLYYGFGVRHYWFFEMLHFLGGFFMTMFLSNFIYSNFNILVLIGIVTVSWESLEFIIPKIPSWSRYMKNGFHLKKIIPGLGDTVLDAILNFAGALAFLYLTK